MRSNLSLGCWFPWQRREEQPSNQAVMLKKKKKKGSMVWDPSDCHSSVCAKYRDSFMKQIFIQHLPRTRHMGCIGEHNRHSVPEALTTWQVGWRGRQ